MMFWCSCTLTKTMASVVTCQLDKLANLHACVCDELISLKTS